ncbi:MAG: hypothetical protein IJ948_02395 [Clostridia bacterium]|nr:hypothetical protein [Clostridia bacterium]
MQKGKLLFKLVTAEDKGQNKSFNSFICVFFVLLCVVFFCFGSKYLFDSTYDVYNEDENTLFYILFFAMLFFVSFFIVWVFNAKKKGEASQLYIYENCVEGTAVTQSSRLSGSLEKFCLSYNDISNISSMERFVIIYTQWQTYKVLAFNKHNEIIRIINMQKEKSQQHDGNVIDTTQCDVDTEESVPTNPQWLCSCGNMISSEPCKYCGKGEKPQENIPENCWKCMGCGKYISLEKDECDCGFKRKYL